MYYRTKITIPKSFVESNEPVVFHYIRIFAKSVEIYVDGEKIAQGGQFYSEDVLIPREFISAGREITIAIKLNREGFAEPGFDQQWFVSPKQVLLA